MAIDKSRTPKWMKVVLIFLAGVFLLGFCSIAANPFSLFAPQNTTQTADPTSSVDQQHQRTVAALTQTLQSNPESYTVLVALGNSYFDWAAELQSLGATNTAAQGADQPMWLAAKDAYRRAVEIKSDEPPVVVDYAITAFYSGDTNRAIELATGVTESSPDFAQAWFNLGIFHGAINETQSAVAALERYLELDPNGQQGNAEFARQKLAELKSGTPTATP